MLDRLHFRLHDRIYVLLLERSVNSAAPLGDTWRRVEAREMEWVLERAFQRDPVFRTAIEAYVRSTTSGLTSAWAASSDWGAFLRDELCCGTSTAALYEAAHAPALPPVIEVEEEEVVVQETDWIGFRVADAIGDPIPNVAVEVFLPDDTRRIVYTNAMGIANLPGVPSGQCRVSILGTLGDAWELQ